MAASGDAEAEADKVLAAVVSAGFAKQLPAGLEEESTLLVANLPFAATALEVGAHFSWYAPVVRVTRLPRADRRYLQPCPWRFCISSSCWRRRQWPLLVPMLV
ncbi:FCPC [Symbiodinium sp. CCMP2456]|nr:FCPC [Symbiodinium sp. CCMP2456]